MFRGICARDEHFARRAHMAVRATARSTRGSSGEIESGTAGQWRPSKTAADSAIMLGRLDKMNDMKYMTPTGTHRDGRPLGISLESLAAQGVSLETGALCAVIQKP